MLKQNKSIAIIGSGISGLTAAHLLCRKYDIILFEQNNYIGGHTNTVNVSTEDGDYAIDTGFIVFNEKTYPNFIKLLQQLGVKKIASNMSFSFSCAKLGLEYGGDSLNGLFAQRKNLFNLKFYRLLRDIYQFNVRAKKFITQDSSDLSLREFTQPHGYSDWFDQCYLKPLASAIWSTPMMQIDSIPAKFILDFYKNHGLLDLQHRPQWYVIKGGSQAYVKKMILPFADKILQNTTVLKVERSRDGVNIQTNQGVFGVDAVVMACHSDQALQLLSHPTASESEILSSLPFVQNHAILHTDSTTLPRCHRAWSSWNYQQSDAAQATLTYYMNKLQSIKSAHTFCVSLNNNAIDERKIIKSFNYSHPVFNQHSVKAKLRHAEINNQNNTFYVGAYWGNGFHEDGVVSSLNALQSLGVGL